MRRDGWRRHPGETYAEFRKRKGIDMNTKPERVRIVTARDIKSAIYEAFNAGWNSRGQFHEELGKFNSTLKEREFERWFSELPTDE